jgi:hypothetical protein
MRRTMHAALVSVSIDAAHEAEAETALRDAVVPMVKALPGFVSGYWLRPVDGKAVSIVIFETEEQALAGSPPPGATPNPIVAVDSVEVREVVANA